MKETVEETVQRLFQFIMGNAAMEGIKVSDELKLKTEQKIREHVLAKRKHNNPDF